MGQVASPHTGLGKDPPWCLLQTQGGRAGRAPGPEGKGAVLSHLASHTSAPEPLGAQGPSWTQTGLVAPSPSLCAVGSLQVLIWKGVGGGSQHTPASEASTVATPLPTHLQQLLTPRSWAHVGPSHGPKSHLCPPNSRGRSQGREQDANMARSEIKAPEAPDARD